MEFDKRYKLTWDDYKYLHTCVLYTRLAERKNNLNKKYLDELQNKLIYAMEHEEEEEFNELKEDECCELQ